MECLCMICKTFDRGHDLFNKVLSESLIGLCFYVITGLWSFPWKEEKHCISVLHLKDTYNFCQFCQSYALVPEPTTQVVFIETFDSH